MSKALANALTLALLDWDRGDDAMTVIEAREFAAQFVEDNLDLLGPPVIVDMQGRSLGPQPVASVPAFSQGRWNAGDSVLVREAHGAGEKAVAAKFSVAPKGADGLDAVQAQAVAQGRPLCPNCQHPEDDHLPGCARRPGEGSDFKAKTKNPLPAST